MGRVRAGIAAALVCGGAVFVCPVAASADDAAHASSISEASAHFSKGVTYYGEADYPAALVEFNRAYSLAPSWRVLFNIGQSHFQMHEYVEAHTALARFLEEGGDQVKPKQRELAQQELASLADRIGRVTIESNLAGATVSVDDAVIGVTPIASPVLMSAGIRRVTATVEGRPPVEQRVSLAGGDTTDVRLDFAPLPAPAPPPPEPVAVAPVTLDSTPPDEPRRVPNRTPAFIAFGAAVAGAAVGGTFGILALDDRSRLDRVCGAGKACPSNDASVIHDLSRDALVSNIGFGVAIVGAAVGVTLWLVAPGGGPTRGGTGRISWSAGPGGIAGTF
jgi:hypothetical protein